MKSDDDIRKLFPERWVDQHVEHLLDTEANESFWQELARDIQIKVYGQQRKSWWRFLAPPAYATAGALLTWAVLTAGPTPATDHLVDDVAEETTATIVDDAATTYEAANVYSADTTQSDSYDDDESDETESYSYYPTGTEAMDEPNAYYSAMATSLFTQTSQGDDTYVDTNEAYEIGYTSYSL